MPLIATLQADALGICRDPRTGAYDVARGDRPPSRHRRDALALRSWVRRTARNSIAPSFTLGWSCSNAAAIERR